MANDDPSDRDPVRPAEQPFDELGARAARAAASQRAKVTSDANQTIPAPEYDPVTKKRFFETVPVPLKRLFGSPLAMSGTYAKGPNRERVVASGWGDPRSTGYNKQVNSAARHLGLDFTAPRGEKLFAMASGTVRFVGFQSKSGGVQVPGIYGDDAKEIMYNAKGEEVASKVANNIGFGGMFVTIRHDGDFQGYQTEYFHMNRTFVAYGQKVQEGDEIGEVGGTGGYYNWFHKGTHLHLQVAFTSGGLRVLVRPTAMVPNYWPNHRDSTNSSQAADIILPILESVGLQRASGAVANALNGLNRANTLQNKGVADIKNGQAQHANNVAQTVDVHRTSLYTVASAFKGQAPVVATPMTFDFSVGTWSDGKVT
jgi:murein DD-endopeptidase MepM/ murein hydrolase activator NlpD